MKKKPRILVIGATGLVGQALLRAWEKRAVPGAAGTSLAQSFENCLPLDITDASSVERILAELRPDAVFLPAANPHVDYCESHPEETRRVNIDGSLNVLRCCRRHGCKMVFFSSDYVFDGLRGPYAEKDSVSPINEYGRQKAAVEEEMLKEAGGHLVLRISAAYGWHWLPKNFVLQIREKLGAGQSLPVAADIRSNPTYAENLAELAVDLVLKGESGLFHLVGSECLSRYDFAVAAARTFGLEAGLVRPVPSRSLSLAARRPPFSSLKTDKLQRALGVSPLGAGEGLRAMASFESQWRIWYNKKIK
ncbi:MAG: SDR family oxidoreductase [Elusimicrobia bacterium]|nr:SDR family oxidoreductase [Elusimicrobiota bacterium]